MIRCNIQAMLHNSPTCSVDFFSQFLPENGRLLGLDVGSKTIGVATCDPERRVAVPLQIVKRSSWRKDVCILLNIIHEWSIIGCVVGNPLHMNGSKSFRSQASQDFCRNLLAVKPEIAILLWDERCTTKEAERFLISLDYSRNKRKRIIDQIAACFILQGVLDRLKN